MAPRPVHDFFIRQNEKPRLETRRRNHAREHHTDRPAHVGARLDRLVTQKASEVLNAMLDAKANEIRQDRPCTSVPADGRHTARAVTGSGSPPKPSGSPAEMEGRRLGAAARCLREGIGEATTYLLPEFPAEHRRRIRTNNMIERLNREIRRRTRVVGCFPDGDSALMLVCARIRDRERVELAPLPRHVPAWRHAGGSGLIIVPRAAMTQSTQSFGHYHAVLRGPGSVI